MIAWEKLSFDSFLTDKYIRVAILMKPAFKS